MVTGKAGGSGSNGGWPELALAEWRGTRETLHRWTQIVGKVRLGLMPWINHSWHVTLYVSGRGLTTGAMPLGDGGVVEIEFDFVAHKLRVSTSEGAVREMKLRAMSVADFYGEFVGMLGEMGIGVRIWPVPCELEDATPFGEDRGHGEYDADAANRFWRVLVKVERVLTEFRSRFVGKVSPVHFFWGSFDLAVTRFSGRRAPLHPGGVPHLADRVVREAYSHEVSSAGFWPGDARYPEAAFYCYAYPEPEGFAGAKVKPEGAFYSSELREFLLPYEKVRKTGRPEEGVMEFLESTYEAAAELGKWDRRALELTELQEACRGR